METCWHKAGGKKKWNKVVEYLLSVILQKDGVNKSSPTPQQCLYNPTALLLWHRDCREIKHSGAAATATAYDMLHTGETEPRDPQRQESFVETQKTVYKQQSVRFVQSSSYLATKGARKSLAHHRELLLSCATITQDQQKHSQEPEVASNCLLVLDACQQLLSERPEWAGIFYRGKKETKYNLYLKEIANQSFHHGFYPLLPFSPSSQRLVPPGSTPLSAWGLLGPVLPASFPLSQPRSHAGKGSGPPSQLAWAACELPTGGGIPS